MVQSPTYTALIELLTQQVGELEAKEPPHGTSGWYLLNILRDVHENTKSSSSAREVKNSIDRLAHFAIDSLEWNGDLEKRVDLILGLHSSLLKAELRK